MANCLKNVQKHGEFLDFWTLVLGKNGIFDKCFEKNCQMMKIHHKKAIPFARKIKNKIK